MWRILTKEEVESDRCKAYQYICEPMKKGDKVHFVPFEGCTDDDCRNGVVKNAFSGLPGSVYVAFDCCNDPDNYMMHRGYLTYESKLEPDWVVQTIPEPEPVEEEDQW